jgi:hypothetical protein
MRDAEASSTNQLEASEREILSYQRTWAPPANASTSSDPIAKVTRFTSRMIRLLPLLPMRSLQSAPNDALMRP